MNSEQGKMKNEQLARSIEPKVREQLKKRAKVGVFSLLIVIFSLLIAACSNPTGDNGDTATITINLGGTARATGFGSIIPDGDIAHDIWLLDGANPSTVIKKLGVGNNSVDPGYYKIRVDASIRGWDYAEGEEQPFTLEAGGSHQANITMQRLPYSIVLDIIKGDILSFTNTSPQTVHVRSFGNNTPATLTVNISSTDFTATAVMPSTISQDGTGVSFNIQPISGLSAGSSATVTINDGANALASFIVGFLFTPVAPSITTVSLPGGVTGIGYSETLNASGTPPITWSLDSGSLPNGLTLAANGTISGTPIVVTTSTFDVKAENSAGSDIQTFSIAISAAPVAPTISTTTLPNGVVGTSYSQTLATSAGTAPITWSVTIGSLPAGLTLNGTTGVISGTPTTAAISSFTIQALNIAGNDTKALSITIDPAVLTGTVSITGGYTPPETGNTLTATYTPGNGTGTVTWLWLRGTTPITGANSSAYTVVSSDVGSTLTARVSYADQSGYRDSTATATVVNGMGTWTARAAAEANGWMSVTYGNGLFVAVSGDGTNRVMTSPDGINWTARAAAEANIWMSVTYGNGLFVAVAESGTNRVMTSPDGITWTARVAAEANWWRSVTYGNVGGADLFVAVAVTGTNRVMTSPDGITWTARAAAVANSWTYVTYGNGLFVAVSGDGTNRVMTSPDGVAWTARAAAEANSWQSVTYGNGLFVAVTYTGTNLVMTSPDGVAWTARAAAEANIWTSVIYGNGLFVAVSMSGTNRVMISPDGITWTARAAAEANQWCSVTYGNGLFVAVSNDGTNRVMTAVYPLP